MKPSRYYLIMVPTSTQRTGFNRLLYRKQLVKKHATTVKMLVDYGADPNACAVNPPSLYSGTALQLAAGWGVRRWFVRCSGQVLIQTRNVDITEVYLPRWSRRNQCVKALQATAVAGNRDIVRLLIDAGANVNARGVGGGSAFAAARNRGNEAIELILLGARTRLRAPIVKYLPV